jgi:hypothetical protein
MAQTVRIPSDKTQPLAYKRSQDLRNRNRLSLLSDLQAGECAEPAVRATRTGVSRSLPRVRPLFLLVDMRLSKPTHALYFYRYPGRAFGRWVHI